MLLNTTLKLDEILIALNIMSVVDEIKPLIFVDYRYGLLV